MRCPECHKFMHLVHVEPDDVSSAAFGWECSDEFCWQHDQDPIEDHAYDWPAYGIDDATLAELDICDPRTAEAFRQMRRDYEQRNRPYREPQKYGR